ncbi:MAG TPA: HAD family phosphatase [Dehalococcoidia bacterium]|nr:HAD family phosphatase [Dehalococcoidia bacterium]
MNSTIELVAFDLGNVLCTVDEIPVAKQLAKISDRDWEEVHGIVFGKIQKLRFETAELSFDEHAMRALANLNIDMPLDEFTALYDSVLTPSENMFPLVTRIAETRRIALVSNTSEPHWKSAERFLPFSSKLDPVIVSYDVDSMKPEPAFYNALLTQSKVAPQNILFVDDLAVNIEAAEQAGMVGHQFVSQSGLKEKLAELGIN